MHITEQDLLNKWMEVKEIYTDFGIRFAKKLSDKWAVKATISAKLGTEWVASDTRHKRECSNCGEGSC